MAERIEFLEPRIEVRTGIAIAGAKGDKGDDGDPGDLSAVEDAIADVAADVMLLDGEVDVITSALSGKASTGSVSAVAADLSTEVTNRTNADTTLQNDINTRATSSALTSGLAGKASAAGLATEITDRSAADATLQSDINTRATTAALTSGLAAKATTTALAQEVTDRGAAITTVTNLANTKADDAATTAALATKASTSSVTTVATNLATEITDRTNADLLSRKKADEIWLLWDTGDDTSKLDADVYFTDAAGDTANAGWTRTILPVTTNGVVGPNRLRVSCPTGLTGANTRIVLPITGSTSLNDEIESVLLGKTMGAQYGHFHRLGTHSGDPIIFISWLDVAFQQDDIWNMNTWKTNLPNRDTLTQGSANGNGNVTLPGLQRIIEVYSSTKTGTTVKLQLPYGHNVVVGDSVSPDTDGILDATCTVTAVSTRSITYTSPTTAAAPVLFGGSGTVRAYRTVPPLVLRTRLDGQTLRVAVWPLGKGFPGWSSELYAGKWTNTGATNSVAGKSGLYVGHLATDTAFVDIGAACWRNGD